MTSVPTVFLSAATVDLQEWRTHLHRAFSRAGFRVLTQDESLWSPTGDVRRLLTESIAASDCVIHLAGLGYGSDAQTPFPEAPAFQCSWTQFEYYHAHSLDKDVIALVCAADLSAPGFVENGTAEERTLKAQSQRQHRARLESGRFDGTPLEGRRERTCNEKVASAQKLVEAVASAVGTVHRLDQEYRDKARAALQAELQAITETLIRLEERMKDIHRETQKGKRSLTGVLLTLLLLSAGAGWGLYEVRPHLKELPWMRETMKTVARQIEKPEVLGGLLRQQIRDQAERELAEEKKRGNDVAKLNAIRDRMDATLAMVESIVQTALKGLELGQNEILQEAILMMQEQKGLAAVESYLDSQSRRAWQQIRELDRIQSLSGEQKKSALSPELLRAELAQTRGDYDKTRTIYQDITRAVPGWGHAHTLLATLYLLQGNYPETLKEALNAVSFAETDPEKIEAKYALAFALYSVRRVRESEQEAEETIRLARATPDADPSFTANALCLHAMALANQETLAPGQVEQIETEMKEAIQIMREKHGADSIPVAVMEENNTQYLFLLNKISREEAEAKMKKLLATHKRIRGPEHGFIGMSLNSLANYQPLTPEGRQEAVKLLEEAVTISKKWYGENHPNVSNQLHNLAIALSNQGNPEAAIEKQTEALRIAQTLYGPDDLRVASRMDTLASFYRDLEQPDKALQHSRPAVLSHLKSYAATGERNPGTLKTIRGFIGDCFGTGLTRDECLTRLRELRDLAQLDEEDLDVEILLIMSQEELSADQTSQISKDMETVHQLAKAHGAESAEAAAAREEQTQYLYTHRLISDEDAIIRFRQTLAIIEKTRAAHHPDIALSRSNLAGALLNEQDSLDEAESLLQAALEDSITGYGEEHAQVSSILHRLSVCSAAKDDFPKAFQQMKRSLDIDEKLFGPHHIQLGPRLQHMVRLCQELSDRESTLERVQQFVAVYFEDLAATKTPSLNPVIAARTFMEVSLAAGISEERAQERLKQIADEAGLSAALYQEILDEAF